MIGEIEAHNSEITNHYINRVALCLISMDLLIQRLRLVQMKFNNLLIRTL